jgi:hypothetical protein
MTLTMHNSTTQDAAKAAATFVTRREAVFTALTGTVAAALVAPVVLHAAPEPSAKAEATFVPENDYPFFGYEPPKVASALADSFAI